MIALRKSYGLMMLSLVYKKGILMNAYNLYSISQSIINACDSHITKVEPNSQEKPCDKLWLMLPNTFNSCDEEIYLTVSPLKPMAHTGSWRCIVYKVAAGVHTVLSDLSDIAEITINNAVSYIKCLSNYASEPSFFPPKKLMKNMVCHLNPEQASLMLFGGVEGTGKTTTTLELADYVIDNNLYRSDDVLILNNEEDFSVLLENISVGRIRKPSLIIFDELGRAGDMFAVSTLLAANCSVVVVTSANTFSGMINGVLNGLEGQNLAVITDEIKTHLVYMVLHTTNNESNNKYTTMTGLNSRGLNLFDLIQLNEKCLATNVSV